MQLREMSKKQKLLIIIVATAIALLFYANLIALNLIAVSQLSMYAAAVAAAALTVIALTFSFIGKRKSAMPKTLDKPLIRTAKIEKPAPSIVQPPVKMEKTPRTAKPEIRNSYLQTKQPTVQPTKQPPTQSKSEPTVQIEKKPMIPPTVKQLDIKKPVLTPLETKETKNGKLKCQNCSKEFSQPILMADYSNPNQPDLVPHCPYCFKPLSSQQKVAADEEAWKKYV